MTAMRSTSIAILFLLTCACSHPLEIVGAGDILSASGNRDCLFEEHATAQENCTDNIVTEAYAETYFAVPRSGWQFDSWVNYCANAINNECSFNFTAATVFPFWGETFPPLRAVFVPLGCPQLENVQFVSPVNWAEPPSQTRIPLLSEIRAMEFTATSNPGYGGQISIASTTGNSSTSRRVWVSQCPGAEPLPDPQCEQTGTSSTVVKWYQGPQHSSYCNLTPNSRYYINIQNLDCVTNNCDVYRNLYNNGVP